MPRDAVEIRAHFRDARGLQAIETLRPHRSRLTTPALSSTCRCLVTACRVSADPSASRAIESGMPSLSLRINESRVVSPSAANTADGSMRGARDLCRVAKVLRDVCTWIDHPWSFMRNASSRRCAGSAANPEFDHCQQRPARNGFERELNQRHRL